MGKSRSTRAQEHNSTRTVVTCALIICAVFCRASADNETANSRKDSTLQVYLPREVTIKDSYLSLGQISIIRGGESLVAKASEIPLGRISAPGQKIIIDRPMVFSRLACNGIPASKVTLTGAEKITVKQQQQTVSSDEFVALASSLLEKNLSGASVCQWNPTRKPKDLVISGTSRDIRFSPRLVKSNARNQARVEIAVLSGGKEIGTRDVILALKYNYRQVVTKVDIPAGGVINPDNVKVEKITSNNPEPTDWRPPYGLVTRRQIPSNTVLTPHMLRPVQPAVIVARNQNVVIRIERPGLLITAIGKAMQPGKAGEYIEVRNADSQRIILAKVNDDGSVEPVF